MTERRSPDRLRDLFDRALDRTDGPADRVMEEIASQQLEATAERARIESIRMRWATCLAAAVLALTTGLAMRASRVPAEPTTVSEIETAVQMMFEDRTAEAPQRRVVEAEVLTALFVGDLPE
jgi:hypothetical protein